MSTNDEKVNIYLKKFLTQQQITENFLDYLHELILESFAQVWQSNGVFDPDINVTQILSSDTVDTFDIITPLLGTDGPPGHILNLDSADSDNIPFENATGVDYFVGLRFQEIPTETEVNVRTGEIKSTFLKERIGELADPDVVVDDGDETLTITVDSVFEAGVSNAGRKVLVYLKNAVSQADTSEEATVIWDGSNNKIETLTSLGQALGSISVDPADYQVFAIGSTVRRNTDLTLDPDILYIGKMTGDNGNVVTTFDQTDVNNLSFGISGILSLFGIEHSVVDGSHEDITVKTITTKPAQTGIQLDTKVNAGDEDTPDAPVVHTQFSSGGGTGVQNKKWVIRDSSNDIIAFADAHGNVYVQNLKGIDAILSGSVNLGDNISVDEILISAVQKSLSDMIYIIDSDSDGANSYKFYNRTEILANLLMELTSAGDLIINGTTQSTDKDTGALVVDGGVGIEKNLNVGGNATVEGDLTVNGTTTTLNTQTLDVEDSNISVNKGGNQAAADLNDAGVKVEMTDATDAQVHYDSSKASKFKAGEVGSEEEILTSGHTQSMDNKTSSNMILDNDTQLNDPMREEVATDAVTTGATATIASLPSPVIRLTNGSLSSLAALATPLEGKVITLVNATGNSLQIENDNGATAAQGILTGTGGNINIAPDSSIILKYDDVDSRWRIIGGSGSGGGAGEPGTYASFNAETDILNLLNLGNNATWDNGGAHQATTVISETAPINGSASFKSTQAAGSLNDWVASDIIEVPLRARGKFNAMELQYLYDGDDDDKKAVVKDVTPSVGVGIISSGLDLFKNQEGTVGTLIVQFYVPLTCTQIKIGDHTLVENIGKILQWDDIILTDDPFVYKNLLDEQFYTISQAGNALTDRNGEIEFNLGGSVITNEGVSLLTASDDSGNTRTKWTANRDCAVQVSLALTTSAAGNRPDIRKNGTVLMEGVETTSAGSRTFVSLPIKLAAGEFITLGTTGSIGNDALLVDMHFRAWSSSEHVTTPSKSGQVQEITLGDGNGHGSSSTKIRRFTTIVRNEGSGLISDSGDSATLGREFTALKKCLVTISWSDRDTAGVEDLGFSKNSTELTTNVRLITKTDLMAVTTSVSTQMGSVTWTGILEIGDIIRPHDVGQSNETINAHLSITARDLETQFLSAIQPKQIVHFKDRKGSAVNGGTFTLGADRIRDINELSGDKFATLDSNQITLETGKYLWVSFAPANAVVAHYSFLHNVTDAAVQVDMDGNEIIGTTSYAITSGMVVTSNIVGTFEITGTKVFEIRHRGQNTRATDGFGGKNATGSGVDSIYTNGYIVKLR